MIKILFDNNAIIDLEENRPNAEHLRDLIRKHNEKEIEIKLPAIQASERKQDGIIAKSFEEYITKITRIGLGDCEIYRCLGIWGLAFWGHALWSDGKEALFTEVKKILFPEFEFDWITFANPLNLDINDRDSITHKT